MIGREATVEIWEPDGVEVVYGDLVEITETPAPWVED